MELPPELAVPSCGRCKELHLDRMDQDALVQQLRDTYMRSLQGRARIALDALRQLIAERFGEAQ